jgi:formate dehydrogenase subunit gamma
MGANNTSLGRSADMAEGSRRPSVHRWLLATSAAVLAGVALALTLGLSAADAQQGPHLAAQERPGGYDAEAWRSFRDGQLLLGGLWAMAATIALLTIFFLLRGRIRIEQGWAGLAIPRFTAIERLGHWLLALSFIVLALTGLNVLYGRQALLPLIGPEAFSAASVWAAWLHTHVAFAFMAGLALTFVAWVRHALPHWRDVVWLAKGGGMLVWGSRPPAWKFDAGQKILFWIVMLGGVSLSVSGLALMFQPQGALLGRTFALVNRLGLGLPAEVTPIQEMQYLATLHGLAALVLIVATIAHVYIRTLGMQGALSAMGSGQVDANWAKEHHSLWAERELARMEAAAEAGAARPAPAE